MTTVHRFAMDEGYPRPADLLGMLRRYVPALEIGITTDIDRRLNGLGDADLMRALSYRGWRGLITTDSSMLNLPLEMTTLHHLKMSLVVVQKAQNEPIAAIGLLMLHLGRIAKQHSDDRAQVWNLRAKTQQSGDAWSEINKIAKKQGIDPKELEKSYRPTHAELHSDPLEEVDSP